MGKRIYRRFQTNPDGSRTYLNIEGEKRHHRTSVTRQRNGVPRVAQHERRAQRRAEAAERQARRAERTAEEQRALLRERGHQHCQEWEWLG